MLVPKPLSPFPKTAAAVSPSGSFSFDYMTLTIIICVVVIAVGLVIIFINFYLARRSQKKTEKKGAKKEEQPLAAPQPSPAQTMRPPSYPSAPAAQQPQYGQPGDALWRNAPQNVYASDPYMTNPAPPEQYQAQWGTPYPYSSQPPQGTAPQKICRYCGAYIDEGARVCPNCQNPAEELRTF